MTKDNLRRCVAPAVLIIFIGIFLVGCGDGSEKWWREEVRMLDGRIIVVEQKRRLQSGDSGQGRGTVGREGWLRYPDPKDPRKYIEWHERLHPTVLNQYNGMTYILARPFTDLEWEFYGSPKPRHIGFKLQSDNTWVRIKFTDIPPVIYQTNLLIREIPKDFSKTVLAVEKDQQLQNPGYIPAQKSVDLKD